MHTRKFILLAILCLIAFIADIALGSVTIAPKEIYHALFVDNQSIFYQIILNHRLPKAITALLIGSSLSVAGLLMQTLFRNPLAGPDVLGINSGASLGVALLTLGGASIPMLIGNSYAQVIAAILGAILILALVLLTSTKVKNTVSLLIVGVMFGYFTSSIVRILQYLSNPDTLKLFITWTFGSLSAVGWDQLQVLAPVLILAVLLALLIVKPLNAFLLGSQYAKGLGVSIDRTRLQIILITSILAGTATAFTGPIGFIGITIPHIARGLFKTSNHKIILPASVICGATVLLICDIISQMPSFNTTLPINAVTSLFGAPIILWILLRKR